MDKNSYEAAIAAINDADKDTLTTLDAKVTDFGAALDTLKSALADILADFPTTNGPVIGARSILDNVLAQTVSCTYQVQSMQQSVETALAAYTPAPTVVSPQG